MKKFNRKPKLKEIYTPEGKMRNRLNTIYSITSRLKNREKKVSKESLEKIQKYLDEAVNFFNEHEEAKYKLGYDKLILLYFGTKVKFFGHDQSKYIILKTKLHKVEQGENGDSYWKIFITIVNEAGVVSTLTYSSTQGDLWVSDWDGNPIIFEDDEDDDDEDEDDDEDDDDEDDDDEDDDED